MTTSPESTAPQREQLGPVWDLLRPSDELRNYPVIIDPLQYEITPATSPAVLPSELPTLSLAAKPSQSSGTGS
jgi:hypothetical protein